MNEILPLETNEDVLTFSLTAARVAPGEELLTPEGKSIEGTSMTIRKLDGSVKLRYGVDKYDLKQLGADEYGTIEFVSATKKFIRTVGTWNAVGTQLYSRPGTVITIAGSTSNDGDYTAVSVGTTVYAGDTLVVAEVVTDEAASAAETVTGYYPRRSDDFEALTYPAMVTVTRRINKLFLENTAQASKVLVLYIGKANKV